MKTMATPTQTVRQELHRLALILRHVEQLSPAGRQWLLSRLEADEDGDA